MSLFRGKSKPSAVAKMHHVHVPRTRSGQGPAAGSILGVASPMGWASPNSEVALLLFSASHCRGYAVDGVAGRSDRARCGEADYSLPIGKVTVTLPAASSNCGSGWPAWTQSSTRRRRSATSPALDETAKIEKVRKEWIAWLGRVFSFEIRARLDQREGALHFRFQVGRHRWQRFGRAIESAHHRWHSAFTKASRKAAKGNRGSDRRISRALAHHPVRS